MMLGTISGYGLNSLDLPERVNCLNWKSEYLPVSSYDWGTNTTSYGVITYHSYSATTTITGDDWTITYPATISGTVTIPKYEAFSNYYNVTSTATTDYHKLLSNTELWKHYYGRSIVADPNQQLRDIIRGRQSPVISRNRKPIDLTADIRETRARQTLRKIVGDEQFFNFLKHGFVSLRVKSGRTYQIFPGHQLTCVYEGGKMVERLCVVLEGNFPPTDSVIMRYLLLLNDEGRFIKTANRSGPAHPLILPAIAPQESLPEIFRRLKRVA